MPDIRDIADPTPFLPEPSTPWWHWAILAFGLLIITSLIIFVFVRKNNPANRRKSLLDKARAKLKSLRKDADTTPLHTVATRASIIIRSYLEQAFEDPAIFETNEEFTLRPTALQSLPPDTRTQVTEFLQNTTTLKYSPHQSDTAEPQDSAQVIDQAENLISLLELHPSPKP